MDKIWVAFYFSSSSDPGVFLGVFNDKDDALKTFRDYIHDVENVVEKISPDGEVISFGIRSEEIGQVFSVKPNTPQNIEI